MQAYVPFPNSNGKAAAGTCQRAQVDLQLVRLLRSKTFERASRLRGLLEYLVVNKTLGRRPDEVQIAIEFFGKPRDFEPTLDPGIRVQIGRLRQTLVRYYQQEGLEDPIRISIPPRTYTPEIEVRETSNGDARMSGRTKLSQYEARDAKMTPMGKRHQRYGGELVVLPFANLTNNEKHAVFCYGLTEEIASALGNGDGYRVVANSSAFQFKNIPVDVRKVGRQLGAAYVLEGSVRMERGNVRVTAQLARTADGMAVWSSTFDAKVRGTLTTQSSVARRIADTIPTASQMNAELEGEDSGNLAESPMGQRKHNELAPNCASSACSGE